MFVCVCVCVCVFFLRFVLFFVCGRVSAETSELCKRAAADFPFRVNGNSSSDDNDDNHNQISDEIN